MVQNPCVHQLRLVVSPIIYSFFLHPKWFSRQISSNNRMILQVSPWKFRVPNLRVSRVHSPPPGVHTCGSSAFHVITSRTWKGTKKNRGFWGFFGVMFCPQTWESKAISQVFVPWKNPSEGSFYSPPLSWKKGLVSRGVAVRNLRFPCNVLLKHKDYCWVWQKTIMAEEHGEATSFRCCVVLSQQKILQRLAFSDFSSYVFLISPYNGWRQKLQPRFPKGLNGCLLRVLCLFEVI